MSSSSWFTSLPAGPAKPSQRAITTITTNISTTNTGINCWRSYREVFLRLSAEMALALRFVGFTAKP
jgi:hypothetical protein